MSTEFTKGQLLTAIDLNELADAACQNIIGGPGCAVTKLGKRVVIGERTSQKIQRGDVGSVWRLTSDLSINWVRDTGHDSARYLAVNDTYCYAHSLTDVGASDRGVFQYTASGNMRWAVDPGLQLFYNPQEEPMAILGDYLYTFTHNDGDAVKKLDAADGSEVGSVAGGVNLGYSTGARSDGSTYIWFYSQNTAPAINWLRRIDSSLTITSYNDGTGSTKGAGGYPIHMVLPTGAGLFVASQNFDNWASDQTAIKLDATPTFAWGTSLTGTTGSVLHTEDVAYYSGDTYWVGDRNNTFPAGAGAYASVWKLDSSGAVEWYLDTGADTNSIAVLGSYIYVVGVRSNTWPSATGYASLWKIDFDGNIIAIHDFGTRILDDANTVVYKIRANATHLFIATDRTRR